MATMRFYRKSVPQTPVNVGGNQVIPFATLNNQTGFYATDNEAFQRAFQEHIENGRFGLSEISWDEFNSDYIQKKKTSPPLSQPWREEFSNSSRLQSASQSQSPVAGVKPKPIAVAMEESPALPSTPPIPTPAPQVTDFRPATGRPI